MKKFPIRLAWDFIGDFYQNYIKGDDRRKFEASWQTMQDKAAEVFAYADYYQRAKSPFEVEPYAPWGNFNTTASLIDLSTDVDGFVIGLRNGYWVIYSESENNIQPFGSFRLFDSSESYSTVTVDGDSFYLVSPTAEQSWETQNNPSFAFGSNFTDRFETIGSVGPETGTVTQGIRLKPQWVNWVILQDKYWLDGGQNWSQLWRMKVENWDNSDSLRSISVNSFGDAGPSYEIRLFDDGASVKAGFGKYASTRRRELAFSGNTITRTRGNFIGDGYEPGMSVIITDTDSNNTTVTVSAVTATELTVEEALTSETTSTAILTAELNEISGNTGTWRNALLNASESDPVEVIIEISYNAASATLASAVTLNGQTVTQNEPYSVMPGRRKNILDVFNQYRTVDIVLDYVYGTGQLFEQTQELDFSTDVGFGFIYEIDEPLVDGTLIQTEPWPLAAEAEVISQDTNQIIVEVDEDWLGYAPDFVKITKDSEFISGEKVSQEDSTVTYDILKKSQPALELSGSVRLRPWYTEDITWIAESQFATTEPLPTQSVYIQNSRAVELDMYNRYGRILGLPNLPDSQEYLDGIRGTQFALLKPATYQNLSNAIGAIIGVPYSNKAGYVTDIRRITNELGRPLYDEVVIDGSINQVRPFWADNDLLVGIGKKVDIMGSLLNQPVNIYDWKNNPELILSRVESPWEQWGTILVQIPGIFGATTTAAELVTRALDRSISIHSNYLIEYYSNRVEDISREYQRDRKFERARYVQEQYGSTSEDMTFGDMSGVVNNSESLQLLFDNIISEEVQFNEDYNLDSVYKLDQELGFGTLFKPRVKIVKNNLTGIRTDDINYHVSEMVFMKEGFRTYSFEEYDPTNVHPQGPKPYEMAWAFEGNTDTLASNSSSWKLLTSPGGSHFDAFITKDDSDITYIGSDLTTGVGGNGAIYRSNDGGKSFSIDLDTGSSGSVITITKGFAATTSNLYELIDGTWTLATPPSWTSAGFFAQVIESAGGITYAVGTVSSETYLSIHDGTSWTAPTSIFATAAGPVGMHVPDASTIWIGLQSGAGGVLRSLDGGQTWDHFESGTAFREVHQYADQTIIASPFSGAMRIASNPLDATPTFTNVSGGPTLVSMDCVEGYVYGCTSSQIYYSTDGGFTWVNDTPSSPSTTLVRCEINSKIRIVIGDGEIWIKR